MLRRSVMRLLPKPVADALRSARRSVLNRRGAEAVFGGIYRSNGWGDVESVSGPGSTLKATENVRAMLPGVISELGVTSLLDIPCGDANWIGSCLPTGISYIGGDIVSDVVARNIRVHAGLGEFRTINLVSDALPAADLLLVRDCLIHLPNRMVREALANIRRSGIGYLLTTTFPNEQSLIDIEIGGFRPINLQHPYFALPSPLRVFNDEDGIRRSGKHLGLWRIADLPTYPDR